MKPELLEAGERIGFGPRKAPKTSDWNGVRKNEKIGGGYFVFRRGNRGGRIFISQMPFEHPSYSSALDECIKLSKKNPGNEYQIFMGKDRVMTPLPEQVQVASAAA